MRPFLPRSFGSPTSDGLPDSIWGRVREFRYHIEVHLGSRGRRALYLGAGVLIVLFLSACHSRYRDCVDYCQANDPVAKKKVSDASCLEKTERLTTDRWSCVWESLEQRNAYCIDQCKPK